MPLPKSKLSYGHKYPATRFERKAVRIIGDNPGITASEFAKLCWIKVDKLAQRRAAGLLTALVRKKLLFRRPIPDPFKGGPIPPRMLYWLTDYGFDVYAYWRQQT